MTAGKIRKMVIATNQYAYGDARTGEYLLVDPDYEFKFDDAPVETIEAKNNTVIMWLTVTEDMEQYILARDKE